MLSDSIIQGRLSLFQFKFQNLHKIFYALHVAAQMEKDGIKLVIFKGASSNLAVELAKVMVRYAR